MDYTSIIGPLFVIIAILTAVVNIITEVCKATLAKVSGSKTINLFVLGISEVLTIASLLAYWQIKDLTVTWYIVGAFIVIGFLVAYAAMFGFDKLLVYFEEWVKTKED